MFSSVYIGIDVGNYDTKAAHVSVPSGFSSYKSVPYGNDDNYLVYNGTYYISGYNRFKYVENKTTNENCFILTLMAISKELIYRVEKKGYKDDIQKGISLVSSINLAVGLPPAHLNIYKVALKDYYKEKFGNIISYEYGGYHFSYVLKDIDVYPQDYSAVKYIEYNSNKAILDGFKDYYAIDIGGYTVDVVPIIGGRPNGNESFSEEMGILKLYDSIISAVKKNFGKSIDAHIIYSYLKGEPTLLNAETKDMIEKMMQDWADEIINKARQSGIFFDSYPVIFIGGGSLLLKKYFENNDILVKYEFCEDEKANAKGFEWLMKVANS